MQDLLLSAALTLEALNPAPAGGPIVVGEEPDVVRPGTNRPGPGLYRWRCKGLDGVWEGVMAHEVEIMHPGAIRVLPVGYKAADYARLELKRVV